MTGPAAPPPFGGVPVGSGPDAARLDSAPFGVVPVGDTPPWAEHPRPVPAPPSASVRRAGGLPAPLRRTAVLVLLPPLLALPLVLLAAHGAGQPPTVASGPVQSVAGPVLPLSTLPGSAAAPAQPVQPSRSSASARPGPARSATAPAPAARPGAAAASSAPWLEAPRRSEARRREQHHPNVRPAAPRAWAPSLSGAGIGGLCAVAQQSGRLPGNLVQICHSMYGQ